MSSKQNSSKLNDEELTNVSGGIVQISGWSSYEGICECGSKFSLNDMYANGDVYICSCGRKYELKGNDVYCDGVLIPESSYEVTVHD